MKYVHKWMINFLNRIICYKEVKLRCWAWIEPQENITVNQVFNKVIKEKETSQVTENDLF